MFCRKLGPCRECEHWNGRLGASASDWPPGWGYCERSQSAAGRPDTMETTAFVMDTDNPSGLLRTSPEHRCSMFKAEQ